MGARYSLASAFAAYILWLKFHYAADQSRANPRQHCTTIWLPVLTLLMRWCCFRGPPHDVFQHRGNGLAQNQKLKRSGCWALKNSFSLTIDKIGP